jgi:hypothetical protein
MSASFRIREDKHCLNCGHFVPDIYCSHCGQPNTQTELTVKDLLHDFIHMLTHFDGKFFKTVRVLFTRPGFLTRAYLEGKRRQYLPPVQMYVFTSAVFFFIFYAIMLDIPDSAEITSEAPTGQYMDSTGQAFNMTVDDSSLISKGTTPEQYILEQEGLPEDKRDGMIDRKIKISQLKIDKNIQVDGGKALYEMIHSFLKHFPRLLLISLPLMALILNLFFYRNKSFTYVSHLIFLLHLYIFTLVALLISYFFTQLNGWTNWPIFSWIAVITDIWILYYGYRSMRNLYQTSKWKARLQYLILLISGFIILTLLFLGDVIFAILTVEV